jgi:hypothetical protein
VAVLIGMAAGRAVVVAHPHHVAEGPTPAEEESTSTKSS